MREPILKKETQKPTMAKPNARPSGMAMVTTATRLRQLHHDGLFDAACEGIYLNA